MKITIYTITDCQFSKQEKEYLASHQLQFEDKNLETNKEWLTEMLAVSNNFAGTPVTKIEKDDGQIVILKGFTRDEFDQTLGFAQPATPAAQSAPAQTPAPVAPPAPQTVPPVVPPAPVSQTPDPLNSILNDLQSKANISDTLPATDTTPVAPTATAPNAMPNIPEPDFK